ncbi:MAG TPA: TonB-dependent receptor [Bryobacteraceae bacterium]|nr:TonB-dependent receptor [Bryobacteraceae bacterium]
MRRSNWIYPAGCAAMWIVVTGSLFGQVNTATIYGTVEDPTGAAVSAAHITAKSNLTGANLSTASNDRGAFTFNFLPPGTYTFTVEATGFQKQQKAGVEAAAGQTITLPFRLVLGAVSETIVVSGAQPLLNTESAEQHSTAETEQVYGLPLAKQDWTGLLALNSGVNVAGKNPGGITLNGLPPLGVNLTVDGTNATQDPEEASFTFKDGFNVINAVNSEAISEISTTKGIAPASVSGSLSGNINIITKSGTNQFHGSLLELNSVSSYNARNQFLTTNPSATFNEFGGSLGGAIIHDKLFFFGDYEGVRSHIVTPVSGVVPTPELDSQVLASAPFYAPVLNAFPLPNQPYAAGSATATFLGSGSMVQNDSNAVGRLDDYFSPNNRVTLRYSRSRPYELQPALIPINARAETGRSDSYNAEFTHSAASWFSSTRFGYNRVRLTRLDQGFSADLNRIQYQGFNSKGSEDYQSMGGIYSWEETISRTFGRHSLQFGGIITRWTAGRIDSTTNRFKYSSLSDLLANIPSQVVVEFPLEPFLLHTFQFGGFVQDNFHWKPNLSVTLGIRYDYFTVPKERDNRIFNRNPSPLGPGFGDYRDPSQMYDADYPNFAPRIGFAWSLGSQRKTVIRGGSGIFYGGHPLGGAAVNEVLTSALIPFTLTLNRAQALEMGLQYPLNTAAVEATLEQSGQGIANSTISPHYPNPYSMQWTMGIERELPHRLMLESDFVGNRALHLSMVRTLNLPDRVTGVSPNPQWGQFRWFDTSDSSVYNSWQTSLKEVYSRGLSFGITYVYANNMAYGDGDLGLENSPQDNNNLKPEWGPTPYDLRHSFHANFVYELPLRPKSWTGRVSGLLLDGWQVAGILSAASGPPVDITDSGSAYAESRPDVNTQVAPIFDNYHATLQYLNQAAFVAVPIIKASGASARPGDLGRNAVRAPGMWNLDATLLKKFTIRESIALQLRGDFLNALNHTNLGGLVNDISAANFGQLTTATARTVQIGAKLVF